MPFQETAGPLEATVSFAKRQSVCYSFLFLSGIVFLPRRLLAPFAASDSAGPGIPFIYAAWKPKLRGIFVFVLRICLMQASWFLTN